MKLKFCIVMVLLVSGIRTASAEGRRAMFTYGLEWSYIGNVNTTWHHNFFDTDEYRVPRKGTSFAYRNHGEILAHVGADLGRRFNLSLYTGYSGIAPGLQVVPLSLRGTWFYADGPGVPGWFGFLEGGSGICVTDPDVPYCSARLGTGYRLSLSRKARLDFMAGLRLSYASPALYDHGVEVPHSRINRNNNFYSSFSLGIGLTF